MRGSCRTLGVSRVSSSSVTVGSIITPPLGLQCAAEVGLPATGYALDAGRSRAGGTRGSAAGRGRAGRPRARRAATASTSVPSIGRSIQSENSQTPYQARGSTPPSRSSSERCSTVSPRVGAPRRRSRWRRRSRPVRRPTGARAPAAPPSSRRSAPSPRPRRRVRRSGTAPRSGVRPHRRTSARRGRAPPRTAGPRWPRPRPHPRLDQPHARPDVVGFGCQSFPRLGQHRLRRVQDRDVVAEPGQRERLVPGTSADVEHRGRRRAAGVAGAGGAGRTSAPAPSPWRRHPRRTDQPGPATRRRPQPDGLRARG